MLKESVAIEYLINTCKYHQIKTLQCRFFYYILESLSLSNETMTKSDICKLNFVWDKLKYLV